VRGAFEVTKDAAAAAAHPYSVFYQPTGDGRSTARAGRVARSQFTPAYSTVTMGLR
jgi:hypothetical protein